MKFAMLCLVSLALLGAGVPGEKTDLDKIQGTWKVESVVIGGEEMDVSQGFTMIFKRDIMEFRCGDMAEPMATIKLDGTKEPKTIDETVELEGKTATSRGIYELKGDQLKICCAGESRPTKFKSEKGSEVRLITMKRTSK